VTSIGSMALFRGSDVQLRYTVDALDRLDAEIAPRLMMSNASSTNSLSHLTNGFEIVPAVLDRSDVDVITEALQREVLDRSRAGSRHLMRYQSVQQLARDPRLLAIAAGFVGSGAVPFRATLFDKSPENNWLVVWHQDTALPLRERCDLPGWGPWSVKAGITYAHAPASALSRVVALRVHIDDSRIDNGPLRLLPGTHRLGVLSDAELGQFAREIPPVDCVVPAGGIVAMRPLLVHASSKAASNHRRRVLHIEYAGSLRMEDGMELAVA
jgi:ectoine hydroxylase-related dioxygenase (phytanoyl-CoA dioxygenase family)